MKNYWILFFFLTLIAIGLYINHTSVPKERHIHAGFIVFIDGKQQNFSSIDYMSLKPCHDEDHKFTKEEIQDQKAHLHDNVGYIAHSHREGAIWKDLFENMGYELNTSKGITGYINGGEINDILNYPINAYDSAIFFVESENTKLLPKGITKDQILKAEKTSRDCGADND